MAARPASAWRASTSLGTPRVCQVRRNFAPKSIDRTSPKMFGSFCGRSTTLRSIGRRPEMSGKAVAPLRLPRHLGPDAAQILAALPDPVLVVGATGLIEYANAAAEQFFDASAWTFLGAPLLDLVPSDSPLFALLASVRRSGHSISEYAVTLETPRLGSRVVTIQGAPLSEERDRLAGNRPERQMAHQTDRQ